MMKKILALFLIISSFASSQEANLKNYVWKLNELNIDGVSYFTPENEEIKGVYLNILDSTTEDTGYFTSTMCNYLFGNIQIEASQFYFTNNSNSDLDCQLNDNSSFDSLYFQDFYLNHIGDPFQYTFHEDNNRLFLTVTNSDLDTVRYSVYLNAELNQNVWILQKVMLNGQEYFPPQELQNNVELTFPIEDNYKNLYTMACDYLNGDVHVSDSEITMIDGGHSIYICDSPIEDFDYLYMNSFMIHLLDNSFEYSITNDSYNLYLTLTDHLGNQAFYFASNLSLTEPDDVVKIDIYPNPVKNNFTITGTQKMLYRIEIYNSTGKRVFNQFMGNSNDANNIDISHLEKGVYFLSLMGKNQNVISTHKLLKN